MGSASVDPLLMAKRKPQHIEHVIHTPRLYVLEWIRACRHKPADLAHARIINEGYLSGIISGKKKNPSQEKLAAIAGFLGIDVPQLYKPPPPAKLLDQVADYDPELVIRLSQKRKSTT